MDGPPPRMECLCSLTPPNSAVTYQLLIQVKKNTTIEVGKLGRFCFPQGYDLYTGSAKKNMRARIACHLCYQKKKRWHIDYLLLSDNVEVVDVTYHRKDECLLNQSVAGEVVVEKFGASDCQKGCGSHLKKLSSG